MLSPKQSPVNALTPVDLPSLPFEAQGHGRNRVEPEATNSKGGGSELSSATTALGQSWGNERKHGGRAPLILPYSREVGA